MKIKRTDVTWNPVTGFAYGETGRVATHRDRLEQPLHSRKPRTVLVSSMSDLFHEDVPDEFIERVLDTCEGARQHTFRILTKRAERMRDFFSQSNPKSVRCLHQRRNVWLGVLVQDQQDANTRIPLLLQTAAAVRFVSYEPVRGPVHFRFERLPHGAIHSASPRLDWIIVAGESGPRARPFELAWARSTIEQCRAAQVPCFVKQLGRFPRSTFREGEGWERIWWYGSNPDIWVMSGPRDPEGGKPSEWPEDLRIREFPRLS